MKRLIAAFIAGGTLASAATAGAVGTRLFRLFAGDKAQFAGMQCSTAVTDQSYFNCVGTGKYGVIFGTKNVIVVRFGAQRQHEGRFHRTAIIGGAGRGVKQSLKWGKRRAAVVCNPHGYAATAFRQTLLDAGHAIVYRSADSIQAGRRGRRYAAHADSCPLVREEKRTGLRVLL